MLINKSNVLYEGLIQITKKDINASNVCIGKEYELHTKRHK